MVQPTPLLPHERHALIRSALARDGRVIAADLARDLGLSEDTIRRDLRELALLGECRRVYGGALPQSPAGGTFRERRERSGDRKAVLARRAVDLVLQHDFVFLDAGSTNLAIAQALPAHAALTVATHAPAIALALQDKPQIEVLLIGGRFDRDSGAALGAAAFSAVEALRPDLALLGACAVSAADGVQAFAAEDAALKRALAGRARAVAVAATLDKLGTSARFAVLAAADLDHLVLEPETGNGAADCEAAALEIAALASLGVAIHR